MLLRLLRYVCFAAPRSAAQHGHAAYDRVRFAPRGLLGRGRRLFSSSLSVTDTAICGRAMTRRGPFIEAAFPKAALVLAAAGECVRYLLLSPSARATRRKARPTKLGARQSVGTNPSDRPRSSHALPRATYGAGRHDPPGHLTPGDPWSGARGGMPFHPSGGVPADLTHLTLSRPGRRCEPPAGAMRTGRTHQ